MAVTGNEIFAVAMDLIDDQAELLKQKVKRPSRVIMKIGDIRHEISSHPITRLMDSIGI